MIRPPDYWNCSLGYWDRYFIILVVNVIYLLKYRLKTICNNRLLWWKGGLLKAIIITRTSRKLCRRNGRPIRSGTRGKDCGKNALPLTWKWVINQQRWCCWFGEWLELHWSYGGMQYDDTYWQITVANVKRMLINPEERTSLIYRHWFNMPPALPGFGHNLVVYMGGGKLTEGRIWRSSFLELRITLWWIFSEMQLTMTLPSSGK